MSESLSYFSLSLWEKWACEVMAPRQSRVWGGIDVLYWDLSAPAHPIFFLSLVLPRAKVKQKHSLGCFSWGRDMETQEQKKKGARKSEMQRCTGMQSENQTPKEGLPLCLGPLERGLHLLWHLCNHRLKMLVTNGNGMASTWTSVCTLHPLVPTQTEATGTTASCAVMSTG